MNLGAITNMVSSYLPQPVGSITGIAGNFFGGSVQGAATATSSQPAATTQLSSIGSLISNLQNLAQSNPAKFSKITAAIGNKLQTAAGKAQAKGDTTLANTLTSLAQQFQTASQTGQMPSLSSLQSAFTGETSAVPATGLAAAYQAHSQSSLNVLSALNASMPASFI